ncbi:MAG: FliH/SctL family protein [Desulfobacteraceae bacterium]|jgi:hypothetical protein
MNRVEKESCPENFNTHCFPSIQKSSGNISKRDGEASRSFRPLYQCAGGTTGGRPIDFSNKEGSDGTNPLEKAKDKSYKRGFEAGKAQGCKIVQRELGAPIAQFKDENDLFIEHYTQITDTYSDEIANLALAIAQKVLRGPLGLKLERLEQIRRQLRSFLKAQYQLSVKLNGNDFKALSETMACSDPQWNRSTALNILGDADTRMGKIDVENPEDSSGSIQDKFDLSVNKVTDSTPPPS